MRYHHSHRSNGSKASVSTLLGLLSLLLVASSCATQNSTEPNPSNTTTSNSQAVDEFYTPAPSGSADDYFVLASGEDDVEYSYFIDEEDYLKARDLDEHSGDKHYVFVHDLVKHGHGYGDHNHIHIHLKGPHHYHGHYIGIRRMDWTDSLAVTDSQKVRIAVAMRSFDSCARPLLDSFRVQLKPYRDEFRATRLSIIAKLDSNLITRDSARGLMDSAIVKYEAETELLRAGLTTDLEGCRSELDAAIQTILTPVQYAIWVRHRGW
jgi:hypothetical protein